MSYQPWYNGRKKILTLMKTDLQMGHNEGLALTNQGQKSEIGSERASGPTDRYSERDHEDSIVKSSERMLPVEWALGVEPWPQPVEGESLLEELGQVLRRFIVLPQWAEETLALWTLHTYAFELRQVS